MRRMPLLVKALAALGVIAVACGGAAAPTATPTRPAAPAPTPTATRAPVAAAATATPTRAAAAVSTATPAKSRPQGRAIVGVVDLGGNRTDYHNFVTGHMLVTSRSIAEGLAFGDPDCDCFAPNLAQSWTTSPDGLTWNITLRKGVKAHDGSELTADDVVFSFNRILDPAVGHVYRGRFALSLDKAEAIEPHQVRFQMKGVWPAFQYDLDRHLFIMPKKYFETVGLEQFKKKPIGYVPFRLTESVIGEKLEFEAFEDHFMRVPTVKNVTVRLMPEQTTRVAAIKTGELDLAPVEGAGLADVQRTPSLRLIETTQTGGTDLQFNIAYTTEQTPFSDLKVRKAVAQALDRQGFIRVVYNDSGVLPRVATFMDYAFGADKTLQPYAYDVERARALLAEAGYANGFSTQLFAPVTSGTLAQAIASGLSKVSINAEVVTVEDGRYGNEVRAKTGLKPGMYLQSYPAYFDVSVAIDGMYRFGSGFGLIKDSVIDDLQERQAQEGNSAKREELLKQMVRRVYDNYYKIGIYFRNAATAVGPRIKDWKPEPHESTMSNFEYLRLN